MKKKTIWVLAAMLVGGTGAIQAQSEMLNADNGKAARRITFDCEQVTVTYKDGSQEENVQTAQFISTAVTTGISETEAIVAGGSAVEVYDLQGRRVNVNVNVRKGVFIVKNGNKTTVRINK